MKGYTPVLGCESKEEAEYITKRVPYKTRIDFGYFGFVDFDWMIFVPSSICNDIDTSLLVKFKYEYRRK